jgi:hypothetical protein
MSVPADTIHQSKQAGDAEGNRDAIIFIPGLRHDPGKEIRVVGRQMVAALDRQAEKGAAKFLIEEGKAEDYQGNQTNTATIYRRDEAEKTAVIDLYELSYAHMLTSQFKNRTPILQVLSIAWLLILHFPKYFQACVKAFVKPRERRSEILHIIYSSVISALVIGYVIVLLITSAATVNQLLTNQTVAGLGLSNVATIEFIRAWFDYLLPYFQGLIIISTGLGLFTAKTLKYYVYEMSLWHVSSSYYLSTGDRRPSLTGQVYSLLEHISEKDPQYQNLHIVAYSFGSIVALDAMFPDDMPSRRNCDITTLVTIGCPFAFIRTFWTDYFQDRDCLDGAPQKWLNIYAEADVMATNFQNLQDPKRPSFVRRSLVRLIDPKSKVDNPKNLQANTEPPRLPASSGHSGRFGLARLKSRVVEVSQPFRKYISVVLRPVKPKSEEQGIVLKKT